MQIIKINYMILKKILFITILFIYFFYSKTFAQSPQKMSYQTIIRNGSGALVTNTTIGVKISILQNSATGTVVFAERHTPTTNTNGLASLEIGTGTVITGSFVTINWATTNYYLKTETDIAGGTNYTISSTTQMLSVPYALYAANSGGNWTLNGNAVTRNNFIGSTNDSDVLFKRNNKKSGLLALNKTAIGVGTLNNDTTGKFNLALGTAALYNNGFGKNLIAIGDSALYNNGVGAAFGGEGYDNLAIGLKAGYNLTTGSYNLAIGNYSLNQCNISTDNTAVGHFSLTNNVVSRNSALGSAALYNNTTGTNNCAFGYNSLTSNKIGNNNTAIGTYSLGSNLYDANTAIGSFSLAYSNSSNNTAVGYNALNSSNTGGFNTAVGSGALQANSSGYFNCALGNDALNANIAGIYNTALGGSSLKYNTTGSNNVALGIVTLLNNNGSDNVAIGSQALYANTTADKNIAIGTKSLYYIMTGSNNVAMGYNAGPKGSGSVFNTTCIGFETGWAGTVSNQINIGNFSVTNIGGQVNWGTYSDKRIKNNIQENVPGLSFITKLKPVTYNLDIKKQYQIAMNGQEDTSANYDGKYDIEKIKQTGFLAQDVEQAAKDCNYNFSGVEAPKNANGLYKLRYAEFVVPLVQSVKEQQKIIESQNKRIADLEKQMKEIKTFIDRK